MEICYDQCYIDIRVVYVIDYFCKTFRYELFWLPLLAQSPATAENEVAAPLDIAWVWHVHMLSPINYEKDCNEIVSTLVDHRILVGEKRKRGLEKAMVLWKELYPTEPFEVDLTAPVSNAPGFTSRIQYDIAEACSRQRTFYYQVSLPHYGDEWFLAKALERYKQHLKFKQQNPDMFFVPCYDFDLIWHAHQVHPLIYKNDTTEILGRVLNHDDSVNDRRPGSKLTTSEAATRKKWKEAGQEFAVNGAMFRGEPPLVTSTQVEPVDYTWLGTHEYSVFLTGLEIEGLPKPKSYTIEIDDVFSGKTVFERQVLGPVNRILHLNNLLKTFTTGQTKRSQNVILRVSCTLSVSRSFLWFESQGYFSVAFLTIATDDRHGGFPSRFFIVCFRITILPFDLFRSFTFLGFSSNALILIRT